MISIGWLVYPVGDGTFSVGHTEGFFVAGFASRVDALLWLRDYLLGDLAQQRNERLARDRILAELEPHGQVS